LLSTLALYEKCCKLSFGQKTKEKEQTMLLNIFAELNAVHPMTRQSILICTLRTTRELDCSQTSFFVFTQHPCELDGYQFQVVRHSPGNTEGMNVTLRSTMEKFSLAQVAALQQKNPSWSFHRHVAEQHGLITVGKDKIKPTIHDLARKRKSHMHFFPQHSAGQARVFA
jgi:hypothetical protein